MTDIQATTLAPMVGTLSDDPERIVVLLCACDEAMRSYAKVLHKGVDRSDIDLARDQHYRRLLLAGQRIQRVGGAPAVSAATRYLSGNTENAQECHFDRLWHGLLPKRDHRAP